MTSRFTLLLLTNLLILSCQNTTSQDSSSLTEATSTPSPQITKEAPLTLCELALKRQYIKALRKAKLKPREFDSVVDFTREFININSQHRAPLFYTPDDVEAISCHMADYLKGLREDSPVLYCSERSRMTEVLLKWIHITTRQVNVYTSANPVIAEGHVFLEAQNPLDGSWQIVDPDYNLYYWDGQKRLDSSTLARAKYDDYVPCNKETCSWTITSREGFSPTLLRNFDYFGAVYLRYQRQLTINIARFDATIAFASHDFMTFPDYYSKYGVSVELYNPGLVFIANQNSDLD